MIEPRSEDPRALQIERTLAVMRCPLAVLSLIAIWLYPGQLPSLTSVAIGTLTAYFVGTAVLNLYLSRRQAVPARLPLVLHASDIAAAAALTVFLGIYSPIFIFLIYPLAAGAYRWGVAGALLTTIVVEALFLANALVLSRERLLAGNGSEISTIMLYAVSLSVVGCLAGYLAHAHKQRERETIDLVTLLRTARTSGEFGGTISLVLGAFLKMFSARATMLVIADRKSGGTFLWRSEMTREGRSVNEELELRPEQCEDYLFELGGAAGCHVNRQRRRARMFDPSGQRIRPAGRLQVPRGFLRAHPFERMIAIALKSNEAWAGRLFVLEPGRRLTRNATVRHVLRVCSALEPDSYGLYRSHHLRVRAQAVERSRIARELHDGVTQSLLGVEMLIAVLRRRMLAEAPGLGDDLLRIHDLVRENIIALREVTESSHLLGTMSGDLLVDLEEIVERFQRHSGLQAKFVSDRQQVSLTLHRRAEAARLVHEGLVNVRKHSGAHRVIVRSTVGYGAWTISIEDDGRGFPFGGRKTQAELDIHRQGPRTVIERARRLGAEVAVESRPGCGSRVEIILRLPVG